MSILEVEEGIVVLSYFEEHFLISGKESGKFNSVQFNDNNPKFKKFQDYCTSTESGFYLQFSSILRNAGGNNYSIPCGFQLGIHYYYEDPNKIGKQLNDLLEDTMSKSNHVDKQFSYKTFNLERLTEEKQEKYGDPQTIFISHIDNYDTIFLIVDFDFEKSKDPRRIAPKVRKKFGGTHSDNKNPEFSGKVDQDTLSLSLNSPDSNSINLSLTDFGLIYSSFQETFGINMIRNKRRAIGATFSYIISAEDNQLKVIKKEYTNKLAVDYVNKNGTKNADESFKISLFGKLIELY